MEYLNLLLLILLPLTLLKVFSWITKSSPTNLPPGPVPLPIFGNLFKLGKKPHESLSQLAQIYGPLMSLKLGSLTTIVISSSTIAKEVLQKHDQSFSSRTVIDAITISNHHKSSIVWLPPTPQWRALRKLTNSHIFTTQKLDLNQSLRHRKLEELVSYLRRNASSGSVIDIGQAAFTTVLNLMSNSFFSIDLADDFGSDSACAFKDAVRGLMLEAGKPNLSDYFPMIRFMDLQGVRRGMSKHFGALDEIFEKIIQQKLLTLQCREGNTSDLLDMILDPSQEIGIQLQRHEIKSLLKDFFAAGTDTTSATIEWAMAELLHNPSKMTKAQQELSDILEKDRLIEESDIVRLPYLQAIIKETLRLHPPAPFLVPHKAENNVEIHDFIVPKGAQVLVNVWAIGRDPNLWKDPTCFSPERFLDSKTDYKGQDFEFIPFGSGRRICPGLPLAHRMVHLIVGLLLQSFDWKLENGLKAEDLDMGEEFGFTLAKATGLRAIPVIRL
ncbi:geraniol 8-hydroxylase-like [Papaver somniferum]|uniref:geraniol 8-hydroxylase-like n=1 Tax=Papaver somniferum TaxID=3469 RepID=UPI000E6F505C|nr:geraniol 8-hydroxylase-like [Papaver somniferum]